MRIVIHQPIHVINAGHERASHDLLPSAYLDRTSGDDILPISTGQIPLPPLLEHLLKSNDYTVFLEDFFHPEDVRISSEDSQTVPRGTYELLIVENPYRYDRKTCNAPWFAFTGTRERIGMPLPCWAAYIAHGIVELLDH